MGATNGQLAFFHPDLEGFRLNLRNFNVPPYATARPSHSKRAHARIAMTPQQATRVSGTTIQRATSEGQFTPSILAGMSHGEKMNIIALLLDVARAADTWKWVEGREQ
ncbi:hypothetical protein EVAR_83348_1 [Eumeta japonica]|uniref:Uncharacterized protein n=1 Tax=Eumeta variegata TaxID=151549 RepID=A0A4C1VX85_EUMVA|nr:hypothetical protein EVAR_83348_1 [Eumeta japonica]